MAQEQQQEQPPLALNAMYPAPPPFYQNFTKQNAKELRRLRKEAGVPSMGPQHNQANGDETHSEQEKDLNILSLPPELRYLIPPPPPSDGTYTTFGVSRSLTPTDATLASQNIPQLYPGDTSDHPDVLKNPQPHLIALARSMLTKYLHILGVLANDPPAYEQSVKELETIVFNMHDLINKYRPHQARESLILMMEERVERLRGECRGIEEGAGKARELLKGFEGDALKMESGEGGRIEAKRSDEGDQDGEGRRTARQERAWSALQQEMGDG